MAAGIPGRIPYARPLAIGAALLALYLLLGFFAAPPLLKRILTHNVAETLKRKVSVGEVSVNPLALSVELKDFALTETDDAPIAAFRRLYADFQLSSLTRRAWTFSELSVEGLDLRADIAPGGRFNLLALLRDLPTSERKPGDALPRVLLQRIALRAGGAHFSDRSIPGPATATVTPIDLEAQDLSTIPESEGKYALSVRLPAGGSVSWRGEVSLQPLASEGEISLKAMKPSTLWRFIGHRLAFLAEPKGEFDTVARYRFSYAGGATRIQVEDLKAAGRGVAIETVDRKGGADLALAAFELTGGGAEFTAPAGQPWSAKLAAPKITASNLEFTDRTRVTPYHALIRSASLGFAASMQEGPQRAAARLDEFSLALNQLQAGEPGAALPVGVLDAVSLEGGSLDLDERRVAIRRIAVTGGELRVERKRDGEMVMLKMLAASDTGLIRREIGGVLREAIAEGKPWRVALEELAVAGMRVAFSDHTFGEPLGYDVRDLRLSLHGYASDGKKPARFDAGMRFEQGGSLQANGEMSVAADRIDLQAKLERLNLKPLAPIMNRHTRMRIDTGELSLDVKAGYRERGERGGAPSLRAGGSVRLDHLQASGRLTSEPLLGWKSLALKGVAFSLAPIEFRAEDVLLDGLRAKIVVDKDRSVNLVRLMAAADAPKEAAPPAAVAVAGSPVRASVERVRLENGEVDFADLSLVLPFGAKVDRLTGSVQGISSDRASRAAVKLEGTVDQYGLARAEGSLSPFDPRSFLDLAVTFRNVEMPPLSPYSATFAGRRIASGKLSLDLNYKINDGKLAGDNRVLLEKFTLGEKVESPDAVNLPLDLAVALLTDSNGRIDIAVPVTGDVNDPQFSYGHVIWQAIRTVIGRIVSAPFRALGSLFGGGSETLESIAFDPGRAALLPPEQEKLKRVAEGLAKRPQIRLVAEGQAGPADRTALAQRDVALAVGARLGRAPAAAGEPDPVNVADAKTQRALEAVFAERHSDEALEKFAADTAKARGKEVERANAALALVGRASADRAFYEALLRRLNETARVTDDALAQLAAQRAQTVATHMTTVLALPASRAGTRVATAPGEAQVKLELELETAAAK